MPDTHEPRLMTRPDLMKMRVIRLPLFLGLIGLIQFPISTHAEAFQLPTGNRALFQKGAEEAFFVGTTGKPWQSGTFGCVRSEGWQMHEGLDIRCLQRSKKGE